MRSRCFASYAAVAAAASRCSRVASCAARCWLVQYHAPPAPAAVIASTPTTTTRVIMLRRKPTECVSSRTREGLSLTGPSPSCRTGEDRRLSAGLVDPPDRAVEVEPVADDV